MCPKLSHHQCCIVCSLQHAGYAALTTTHTTCAQSFWKGKTRESRRKAWTQSFVKCRCWSGAVGATGTVNVLGQYVLSGPFVVVHLFSKCAPRVCTAHRSPARCVLAEQMYFYVRDAKSLLGCRLGYVLCEESNLFQNKKITKCTMMGNTCLMGTQLFN